MGPATASQRWRRRVMHAVARDGKESLAAGVRTCGADHKLGRRGHLSLLRRGEGVHGVGHTRVLVAAQAVVRRVGLEGRRGCCEPVRRGGGADLPALALCQFLCPTKAFQTLDDVLGHAVCQGRELCQVSWQSCPTCRWKECTLLAGTPSALLSSPTCLTGARSPIQSPSRPCRSPLAREPPPPVPTTPAAAAGGPPGPPR